MKYTVLLLAISLLFSCENKNTSKETSQEEKKDTTISKVNKTTFGKLPDGKEVFLFTLKNSNQVEMKVINYGGIIVSLKVPDKDGKMGDVVLGFDSLQGYLNQSPYFGAIVGRFGNRIAKGKFSLDGKQYQLATNNMGNHLHGGKVGYDKVYWDIKENASAKGPSLTLTYLNKDMEEGYPGNLQAEVTYTLTNDNELEIVYKATTDKKTIVNITQHTYFNLSGKDGSTILDHELFINADKFVPVDKTLIPTGLMNVEGTAFDFRTPTAIGKNIANKEEQIKFGLGYDHCWVLKKEANKPDVSLTHPESGRTMEIYTTEPGMQFYSGNFLDGTLNGKNNTIYQKYAGLCLEPEHYPDSPNRPEFPSVVLEPGQTYETRSTYKFLVK